MYGIRAGPLVMATMAVVLALYGDLFIAQGRPLLGLLVLAAALACAGYVIRVYARAAAEHRGRARERERAFVERVRREG